MAAVDNTTAHTFFIQNATASHSHFLLIVFEEEESEDEFPVVDLAKSAISLRHSSEGYRSRVAVGLSGFLCAGL